MVEELRKTSKNTVFQDCWLIIQPAHADLFERTKSTATRGVSDTRSEKSNGCASIVSLRPTESARTLDNDHRASWPQLRGGNILVPIRQFYGVQTSAASG